MAHVYVTMLTLILSWLLICCASECPSSAPAPAPFNSMVCPSSCTNQPCTEDEDPCCRDGQSKLNGCNQCESDYFKKSYNHPCVHCQATFGDNCLFCQDFIGCGQCSNDCDRIYDQDCGLWKCYCSTPTEDTVRYEINPTSFTGIWDPSSIIRDDEEDPPIDLNTTITPAQIYVESQILEVNPDGSQFLTIHSEAYLQPYVDIDNNYLATPDLANDPWITDNEEDEPFSGPTDCESELDDEPDFAPETGRRRLREEYDSNEIDELQELIEAYRRRTQSSCSCCVPIWGDSRWEVTGTPTVHVDKHTGLLSSSGGNCSAALISSRYILTAGHCVHSGKNGDWFNSFRFFPRRTRDGSDGPFGWSKVWSFKGWTEKSKTDWDVAVIRLSSSPGLGRAIFGYDNGIKKKRKFYTRGYPCDKPTGTMWGAGTELKNPKKYRLRFKKYYDITNGNSGGPVYAYKNNQKIIYGVNAAYVHCGFTRCKDAARINSYKFSKFCEWADLSCG